MAKYDWSTFRNYVAFLAGELAPGTRHPHNDSESSSCYHDAFLPWGHYHNNIVLFYHDSPITRSHFMDPTDRAIKGFYCIMLGNGLAQHRSLGMILTKFIGKKGKHIHVWNNIQKIPWISNIGFTLWCMGLMKTVLQLDISMSVTNHK